MGWMLFEFYYRRDVDKVMDKVCLLGFINLFLRWWHSISNLRHEPFVVQHLWVLFLGFPLELWKLIVFEMVGDKLRISIYFSEKSLEHEDNRLAQVLMEIDIRKGLVLE